MLEALLLTAVTSGNAAALAESRTPSKPSLELLEFLGEFGDDDDGLFEDAGAGGARTPARDARAAPPSSVTPKAPSPAPAPPASKVAP